MEIRKEEEEEKEEEIEEEREEEEKEESQEDEKESKKIVNEEIEQPKSNSLKIQKQEKEKEEDEKLPNDYKEENPNKTTNTEEKNKEVEEEQTPENQDQDLESTSTYILKYTRKGDELKEIAEETGLRKSENCLFMLNIKLIKSDSVSIIDPTEEGKDQQETPKEPENFLVFCCHEIAAIYFDEIYERIYTLKDLALENKYFKVFESTEEAKIVIDETIRTNEKNAKKIFIGFKDKELKLHMKLSFFDKEKEIVLNIPKKPLSDEDKVNLLPEFLKEIQDKINHLNDENKKLKARKNSLGNRSKNIRFNYKNNNNIVNESIQLEKEKKEENNSEIKFNDTNGGINNNANINNINNKANNNNVNNKTNNIPNKKVKKLKVIKKKHAKPEENFF